MSQKCRKVKDGYTCNEYIADIGQKVYGKLTDTHIELYTRVFNGCELNDIQKISEIFRQDQPKLYITSYNFHIPDPRIYKKIPCPIQITSTMYPRSFGRNVEINDMKKAMHNFGLGLYRALES